MVVNRISKMGARGGGGGRGGRGGGGGGAQQRTGFEITTTPQMIGNMNAGNIYSVESGRTVMGKNFPFTTMYKGAAQAYANSRIKGKDDQAARKIAYSVERGLTTKAMKAKQKANSEARIAKGKALYQAMKEVGVIK